MHSFLLRQDVREHNNVKFRKGVKYVLETINVAQVTKCCEWEAEINYWKNDKPINLNKDYNHKRIAIMRPGGFGDLLFLTPLCRQLKKLYPLCSITMCCNPMYFEVVDHNEDIDNCLAMPTPVDELDSFDAIFAAEWMMQDDLRKTMHPIDWIELKSGVNIDDKSCKMVLTEKEVERAFITFPRNNKKRIGYQLTASAFNRSYSRMFEVWEELINKRNCEVFILGPQSHIQVQVAPSAQGSLFDLTNKFFTFRESMAIASTCDAIIGQDSGITHAAGALGLKTVAPYASIPWQLRTKYHASVEAINGVLDCAPCHHRGELGLFPHGKPCESAGKCLALETIQPQRIVNKVMRKI